MGGKESATDGASKGRHRETLEERQRQARSRDDAAAILAVAEGLRRGASAPKRRERYHGLAG